MRPGVLSILVFFSCIAYGHEETTPPEAPEIPVFISDQGYRCPPCGCNYDHEVFFNPGKCPHCGMMLVKVPEGLGKKIDARLAPAFRIGQLGKIYTKLIYPVFVFGIVMSVFLLIKRVRRGVTDIFIAGLILSMSLYGFKNQMFAASYSLFRTHIGLFTPISFILLIGPLIYFYTRSQTYGSFVWKRYDWIHCVPAGLMFLYYATLALLPMEQSWPFIFSNFEVRFSHAEQIVTVLLGFIYIFNSYKLVETSSQDEYKGWLRRFLVGMTILLFAWGLMIFLNFSLYDFGVSTLGYNPLWVAFAVLIVWIVFEIISKAELLKSVVPVALEARSKALVNGSKYQKSGLKREESEEVLSRLKKYMETNRVYLDSTITLDKVSSDLKVYKHHISQAVNDNAGMNFYSFVNEFRIKEAAEKLRSLLEENKTIEAISFECGFSSKSTFNSLFRKKYGLTPSEYLKTLKPG